MHMALISMYLSKMNNHSVFEKQQEIQGSSEPQQITSFAWIYL